jgi:hypothetical protein
MFVCLAASISFSSDSWCKKEEEEEEESKKLFARAVSTDELFIM